MERKFSQTLSNSNVAMLKNVQTIVNSQKAELAQEQKAQVNSIRTELRSWVNSKLKNKEASINMDQRGPEINICDDNSQSWFIASYDDRENNNRTPAADSGVFDSGTSHGQRDNRSGMLYDRTSHSHKDARLQHFGGRKVAECYKDDRNAAFDARTITAQGRNDAMFGVFRNGAVSHKEDDNRVFYDSTGHSENTNFALHDAVVPASNVIRGLALSDGCASGQKNNNLFRPSHDRSSPKRNDDARVPFDAGSSRTVHARDPKNDAQLFARRNTPWRSDSALRDSDRQLLAPSHSNNTRQGYDGSAPASRHNRFQLFHYDTATGYTDNRLF